MGMSDFLKASTGRTRGETGAASQARPERTCEVRDWSAVGCSLHKEALRALCACRWVEN